MVMADLVVVPVGEGESLSSFVAEILKVIDESGVTYRLHPMGTVLEGEWADVMGVVDACFQQAASLAGRVSLQLKIDYRAGGASRLDSKVQAVEAKVGRRLRTLDHEAGGDAADR